MTLAPNLHHHRLTEEHGWETEYLEDSVVINLQAPPSGHYKRGDTTNRHKLSQGATYKPMPEAEERRKANVMIAGVEANFYWQTESEKLRLGGMRGEAGVLERMLREVTEEDLFWDVGACVGIQTCLVAQRANRVEAFEPAPLNYKRLKENVDLNCLDNVEVLNQGLGGKYEKVYLTEFSGEAGEGRHAVGDSGYEVLFMQGDYSTGCYPDVAKIDVEGYEYQVLSGMKNILDSGQCRVIYLELHLQKVLEYGHAPDDLFTMLHSFGYSVNELQEINERKFLEARL